MHRLVVLFVCISVVFGGQCPDGSSCGDSQTCCKLSTGGYGCCPYPNAVCCSDGEHCCPDNTKCNLETQTCDAQQELVPLVFRKKPSQKIEATVLQSANKVEVVYCPGGSSYCPDGNTCCLLPSGLYGCCPYQSAMCCNDRVHCCPYGTRCDATSQYCLQGSKKFPTLSKTPAFLVK